MTTSIENISPVPQTFVITQQLVTKAVAPIRTKQLNAIFRVSMS